MLDTFKRKILIWYQWRGLRFCVSVRCPGDAVLPDCRPVLEWLGPNPPEDKALAVGDSVVLLAVSSEALQSFRPPLIYLPSVRGRLLMGPRLPGPGSFSH